MFALVMILFSGYGIGYEGYENNKLYFGLYSPSAEYGYVLTEQEIYLDTVYYKR